MSSSIVGQFVPNAGLDANGNGHTNFGISQGLVTFYNESIYGLAITFASGGDQYYLPAGMRRDILVNVAGPQIEWMILTTLVLPGGSTAPANIVTIESNDEASEDDSRPVQLLAGGIQQLGNIVLIAQQVINTASALGTTVIQATPSGSASNDLLLKNDGTGVMAAGQIFINSDGSLQGLIPPSGGYTFVPLRLFFETGEIRATVLTNATQQDAFRVAPGGGAGVFATVQIDNNRINSDGQGNWFITGNLKYNGSLNGDNNHWSTDGAGNATFVSVAAQGLSAWAAVTLITGHQETGYGAIDYTAAAGAQTAGSACNFKTVMTNTPTSITITNITNTNTTAAPAVDHINTVGFHSTVTSSGAGRVFYLFTYTTVGN